MLGESALIFVVHQDGEPHGIVSLHRLSEDDTVLGKLEYVLEEGEDPERDQVVQVPEETGQGCLQLPSGQAGLIGVDREHLEDRRQAAADLELRQEVCC